MHATATLPCAGPRERADRHRPRLQRLWLLACLVPFFALGSCGGSWHHGKWTLDKERTLAEMQPPAPATGEAEGAGGFVREVIGGLQRGISRVVLTQFEGVEVQFTSSEMRRTRAGSGEVTSYEILERPDSDTLILRYADGSHATWGRVKGGLRLKMPGEGGVWVYFRRAP